MTQLRIASINIERSKHLKRVEKFIKAEQPDVLCLQELCARDIPFIEDLLGNKLTYAPMTLHPAEEELETIGIGMVAWGAMENVSVRYYHGDAEHIQPIRLYYEGDQKTADRNTIANALIFATYQGFRIATTHLNVTVQGASPPWQLESAANLIAIAEAEAAKHGLLLTGDFNAPRGNPTFSLIAEHFIDGVPPHYTTSIDGSLHKAGQLPYMVDGLFHTPTYKLEDPRLHTGVSDHCALTTTLLKS